MNSVFLLEPNNELPSLLESQFNLSVSGVFSNSYDILTEIKESSPNAVFIDIDMKGLDTKAIVNEILSVNSNIAIIFISSTDSFAIEAFRMNVLDYLLKPVTLERLTITMNRLDKKSNPIQKDNPKVTVNVLGTFMVMAGDNPIRWQTAKGAEIFAYLLFHHKKNGVDKWKIINSIYSNKSDETADLNFRSSLSRLNQTLKSFNTGIIINNIQGSYRLEYDSINVDIFKLEEFAKSDKKFNDAYAKQIEELLLSYDGDLFAGFEFQWAKPICDSIIKNINFLSKKLSRFYISKKKYASADVVITHNLLTNENDKEAHEIKLKLLYLTGNNSEADRYYDELVTKFNDKPHVTLPNKSKTTVRSRKKTD